ISRRTARASTCPTSRAARLSTGPRACSSRRIRPYASPKRSRFSNASKNKRPPKRRPHAELPHLGEHMTDDRRSGPTPDRPRDRRAAYDPCSAAERLLSPDRRRVLRTASPLIAGATVAQSLRQGAHAQDARPAPAAPTEPLEIAGFERARVKTS